MKQLSVLLLTMAIVNIPALAHADDFGARFTNDTPAALGGGQDIAEDTPEDRLSEILAIEPAAGDEEEIDAENSEENATSEESDNSEDGAAEE